MAKQKSNSAVLDKTTNGGGDGEERPGLQQLSFEIMPESALGRYSEQFVEQKDRIAREKEKLDPIREDIVRVMRKEKRTRFSVVHLGEKYVFEIKDGKAALKCTRKVD
jgi:hypothetical protein